MMKSINNSDLWGLSFKDATQILFSNYVYIYLEDNSIQQGVITAIRKSDNINVSTNDHLPLGFVINDKNVDISKINHIEVILNDEKQ